MTNETTASQPKSIGDDVKLENLLSEYASAVNRATSLDRETFLREEIIRLFHSSAPAAQASATIQAAPEDGRALRAGRNLMRYAKRAGWPDDGEGAFEFLQRTFYAAGEQYAASQRATSMALTDAQIGEIYEEATSYPLSDDDHHGAIAFARGIIKSLASTIQEPVMVAEPVGAAKPYSCETGQIDEALADFLAEHTRLNQDGIDTHAMNMTLALNYAAISPTPAEEIARWREQGYLPVAAPMVADPAGVDRYGRMSDELRKMIEGMSVSVDVSTGDDDAGNRYFGTVNEVMDGYHGEKHGVVLLIQDPEPNFDLAATVKAVPSEALAVPKLYTAEEYEDAWGDVLWFHFYTFDEPPEVYVGQPEDTDFMRQYDHWTHCARFNFNSTVEQAERFAAPLAGKTGGGE